MELPKKISKILQSKKALHPFYCPQPSSPHLTFASALKVSRQTLWVSLSESVAGGQLSLSLSLGAVAQGQTGLPLLSASSWAPPALWALCRGHGLMEAFPQGWDGADGTNESKSIPWPGHRNFTCSCLYLQLFVPAAAMAFREHSVVNSSASRAVEQELLHRRRAGTVCAKI